MKFCRCALCRSCRPRPYVMRAGKVKPLGVVIAGMVAQLKPDPVKAFRALAKAGGAEAYDGVDAESPYFFPGGVGTWT